MKLQHENEQGWIEEVGQDEARRIVGGWSRMSANEAAAIGALRMSANEAAAIGALRMSANEAAAIGAL